MSFENIRFLVVGAGFFGSVVAERIASDLEERVLVVDKKSFIGGHSHSRTDRATGIEYHLFGSHIFHTDDERVWHYVNRFTTFNDYRHKVLTRHKGRVYHMPVNLATLNDFYGLDLSPPEARAFLETEAARHAVAAPSNFEDKAVSQMGRPLYEAFVRGYTLKQWEVDPRQLPAENLSRIPIRFNYDAGYFTDPWQGIPLDGYTAVFERILAHPRIEIRLSTDFFAIRERIPKDCLIIYTGPIDRYFDYRFGVLTYRTLRFESEVAPVEDFQGTAFMNYADPEVPYTRIHEFRHYHRERDPRHPADKTFITREFSRACGPEDDPYYPVNTPQDRAILALYKAEAARCPNLVCGGRLGRYAYFDMDDTIKAALETYESEIKPWVAGRRSEAA